MRILVADDEPLALRNLIRTIGKVKPDAEIISFTEPEDVLEYGRTHFADVAFLDIEMGSVSGIEVAKQLKICYPKINIIFVTGYTQYMAQAISLRMSGYVMKPATEDAIRIELDDLKYPVLQDRDKCLTVRCFGNFEVFANGKILEFEKAKTKEMFAYLVDREGSSVTTGELRGILWDDDDMKDSNTRSYLSKVKKDLVTVLKRVGAKDVFIESRGKYAINRNRIACDYYDFLDNKPEGIRAYNGEYMAQYSWGELKNTLLKK